MLDTCSKTENPPNPSKKAVKIRLIEICLQGMAATCITPLVSSRIPQIKEVGKRISSIPKALKKGNKEEERIEIILLFFKMDKMTLKRTTKPPIIVTVLIADKILLPKISPKLEKVTCSLELL